MYAVANSHKVEGFFYSFLAVAAVSVVYLEVRGCQNIERDLLHNQCFATDKEIINQPKLIVPSWVVEYWEYYYNVGLCLLQYIHIYFLLLFIK